MHIDRTQAAPTSVAHADIAAERRLSPTDRAMLPPVPHALAALLCPQHTGIRFTEASYYSVEEWQPHPMNAEEARIGGEFLRAVEAVMVPVDKGRLLTRVLALLSHYRSDPNPPEVEYAIAEDWAEDLGEFPAWAIEEAARQWRRSKKFRPQICEIREACERLTVRERTLLRRLRQLIEADLTRRNPARGGVLEITSNLTSQLRS